MGSSKTPPAEQSRKSEENRGAGSIYVWEPLLVKIDKNLIQKNDHPETWILMLKVCQQINAKTGFEKIMKIIKNKFIVKTWVVKV